MTPGSSARHAVTTSAIDANRADGDSLIARAITFASAIGTPGTTSVSDRGGVTGKTAPAGTSWRG